MQKRLKLKSYSHLLPFKRVPTEYDLTTSGLSYHENKGFSVTTPVASWINRQRQANRLKDVDWESFSDPRSTTYRSYVELQAKKEALVEHVLQRMSASNYNKRLSDAYLLEALKCFSVLRYPCHGLQMIAAFGAQMAPAGRITVALAFQSADEMRRVQRFAYQMVDLTKRLPDLKCDGMGLWLSSPDWQPWRKCIELLLATYSWEESFAVLQFAVKPVFEDVFFSRLGQYAERNNDAGTAQILASLAEDGEWHRQWSQDLRALIEKSHPSNATVIEELLTSWRWFADVAAGHWETA